MSEAIKWLKTSMSRKNNLKARMKEKASTTFLSETFLRGQSKYKNISWFVCIIFKFNALDNVYSL